MNTRKRQVITSALAVGVLLLSACGADVPPPTGMSPTRTTIPTAPTPKARPSATPVPPTPSATPVPPTPSATPLPPTPSATPVPPTPTPTRVPLPRLRVVGNQIQNENGDEVILRGLAPVDPLQQAYPDRFGMIDRTWEEDTYQVMSEWGANVVRLPIHPHAWRSLARADALRVLDQAVAWAGKYGMHVMIEFHGGDWPPEEQYTEDTLTSTAEIRQFWDVISSRYADNTVVAFYELYGEPSAGGIWEKTEAERLADWLVWKEYVEELIGVVRANDADKIVIVPGLSYAQDLAFVVEAPIEQENVVYSCHPYPAVYDSVEDWDTHMGEVKSHFPVMVTEFGFNNDSPNWELREDGWEGEGRYGEAIINYLETHGIGWVA